MPPGSVSGAMITSCKPRLLFPRTKTPGHWSKRIPRNRGVGVIRDFASELPAKIGLLPLGRTEKKRGATARRAIDNRTPAICHLSPRADRFAFRSAVFLPRRAARVDRTQVRRAVGAQDRSCDQPSISRASSTPSIPRHKPRSADRDVPSLTIWAEMDGASPESLEPLERGSSSMIPREQQRPRVKLTSVFQATVKPLFATFRVQYLAFMKLEFG